MIPVMQLVTLSFAFCEDQETYTGLPFLLFAVYMTVLATLLM